METHRSPRLRLFLDAVAASHCRRQPNRRRRRRALLRRDRAAVAVAAQPACQAGRGVAQGRRQGDRPRYHLCRAICRSGRRHRSHRGARPRCDVGRRRDVDQDAAGRPDHAHRAAARIPCRRGKGGHRLDRARQRRHAAPRAALSRRFRRRACRSPPGSRRPTCRAARCCRLSARRGRFRPSPITRHCRRTNSCPRISSAAVSSSSGCPCNRRRRPTPAAPIPTQPRSRCAAAIWSRARKSRRRSTRTSPSICSSPQASPLLLAACTIAAALLAAAVVWRGTGWITAIFARRGNRPVAGRQLHAAAIRPALCAADRAGRGLHRGGRRTERARLRRRAPAAAQHHARLLAISFARHGRAACRRSDAASPRRRTQDAVHPVQRRARLHHDFGNAEG